MSFHSNIALNVVFLCYILRARNPNHAVSAPRNYKLSCGKLYCKTLQELFYESVRKFHSFGDSLLSFLYDLYLLLSNIADINDVLWIRNTPYHGQSVFSLTEYRIAKNKAILYREAYLMLPRHFYDHKLLQKQHDCRYQ
jgi:hypothetical protein